MNISILERLAVGTSALLFSLSAFSFTPDPTPDPDPEPEPCQGECDFTRGPNPTSNYLEASRGPYTVSTVNVARSVSGFGGGTIHYPRNTEASRETQLGRALDYVISQSNSNNSPISGMVDSTRVGAMGWSMGGGGTLRIASGSRLSAAIPLAPWNTGSNNFNQIDTPTMIIACENDTTAPVGRHASPFYNRIPSSTDKAYLEINNGAHSCANGGGSNAGLLGKYGVSWMKRFIDNDTRYSQFLCGPNHAANSAISEYRDTCNY